MANEKSKPETKNDAKPAETAALKSRTDIYIPNAEANSELDKLLADMGYKTDPSYIVGDDIGRYSIEQCGRVPIIGYLLDEVALEGGIGENGWQGFLVHLLKPSRAVFGKGKTGTVRDVPAGSKLIVQPNWRVRQTFTGLMLGAGDDKVPCIAMMIKGTTTTTKGGFDLEDIDFRHLRDQDVTRASMGFPPKGFALLRGDATGEGDVPQLGAGNGMSNEEALKAADAALSKKASEARAR